MNYLASVGREKLPSQNIIMTLHQFIHYDEGNEEGGELGEDLLKHGRVVEWLGFEMIVFGFRRRGCRCLFRRQKSSHPGGERRARDHRSLRCECDLSAGRRLDVRPSISVARF